MELYTLLLFIPACFALNMAPGPNNLLSMANAKRHGYRTACLAGLGRLMAFVVMIGLAASGLAVVLHTSERIFLVIKVLGALYLFWLAFTLWNAREDDALGDRGGDRETRLLVLARQEFLVAAGNPKAILIFTAFLPQFVDPAGSVTTQFVVLGVLFLLFGVGRHRRLRLRRPEPAPVVFAARAQANVQSGVCRAAGRCGGGHADVSPGVRRPCRFDPRGRTMRRR